MPSNKLSDSGINGKYSAQLKAIRKFVNFNYDLRKKLTPSQKGKIRRYYNQILSFQGHSQVHKFRNKTLLREAQKATLGKVDKNLKIAPIPASSPNQKTRISFKNGEIHINTNHVTTVLVPFNPKNLARNMRGEVKRVLGKRKHKSEMYTIWCGTGPNGNKQIVKGGALPYQLVPQKINELMQEYNNQDNNSYWQNWLTGVFAHSFTNQKSLDNYIDERRADQKKIKQNYQLKKAAYYRTKEQIKKWHNIRQYAPKKKLNKLAETIRHNINRFNLDLKPVPIIP